MALSEDQRDKAVSKARDLYVGGTDRQKDHAANILKAANKAAGR